MEFVWFQFIYVYVRGAVDSPFPLLFVFASTQSEWIQTDYFFHGIFMYLWILIYNIWCVCIYFHPIIDRNIHLTESWTIFYFLYSFFCSCVESKIKINEKLSICLSMLHTYTHDNSHMCLYMFILSKSHIIRICMRICWNDRTKLLRPLYVLCVSDN